MDVPAKADRVTVQELLQWARAGRLRIPSFQRPLRWEPADKTDLLDSIERGYPIGTLLLWKQPAEMADTTRALPGAPEPSGAGHEAYLVVDGQQRISTLWEALGSIPGDKEFLFELPKQRFVLRARSRAELDAEPSRGGGHVALPLSVALDATELSEWMPPVLPRESKRRLFDVGKRLREYIIPIYLVEGDDIDVLREIFDRTNSRGKSLERDEVFDALVGSRVTGGNERGLAIASARVRDLGFGALPNSLVLKAFEAIRNERVGKSDPRKIGIEAAGEDLKQLAESLRLAARFLQEAGVPHTTVLPYELPLVVLARFFAIHPAPSERTRVALKRWFWRGCLGERLGGASGSLQQHLDDVQPDSETKSVRRLAERTGAPVVDLASSFNMSRWNAATALGKCAVCAFWARMPRNLMTGEKLSGRELFDDGIGSFQLIVKSEAARDERFGNRLLHPILETSARKLIRDCNDEGALASHGIDRETAEALRRDDIDAFLDLRSRDLENFVVRFLKRKLENERDTSPSVQDLVTQGRPR